MIKSGFKTRAGYDGACTVYEYLLKTDGSYNSDWVSIVRSRNKINFSFPFFSNFETNDKHTLTIMKEMTAACRQNPLCAKLDPFDRVACIRRCISPMCYNQKYMILNLENLILNIRDTNHVFINCGSPNIESHWTSPN